MTTNEVRQKYIEFFKARGHTEIPGAPLVLQNDPTTLFTSSGMQPLVPYLMGEPHPEGKRLVNSQPCLRVQDIDEVGDNRHTTFFEMLGNWSLGDYFKKEQLPWIWEFLTEELGLPKEKLYISLFEGNDAVPRDTESFEIWKSLGVPEERIYFYPAKKNWWSRSGTPEQMPVGEIGGPDSEVFYDFGEELGLHEKSEWRDEPCHPNCDCGRFLEIGNSVFIQYKKNEKGELEELPQKNVDFGGGLERLVAARKNDPDMFRIDVFKSVIEKLQGYFGIVYGKDKETDSSYRVIADHVRAGVFLLSKGVEPSNKLQGYILRRLLRRAVKKAFVINKDFDGKHFKELANLFVDGYPSYIHSSDKDRIGEAISVEIRKFRATVEKGMKEVDKLEEITGKNAFDLYQSYGFPLELTLEIAQERGQKVDIDEFKKAFSEHQEKSRTASAGTFKGGLADHSEETTRLHTATHLLHAALRKVLGEHVGQKGSNITNERLRFDFTHPTKMTEEEIIEVEDTVNAEIAKDLPVSFETMSLEEAKKAGAVAFFGERYGEKVKVYTIGNPTGAWFSREVCGGPHVDRLSELGGHVRITKEESLGSGIRRIYATIG